MSIERRLREALSKTKELSVEINTYRDYYLDEENKRRYQTKEGIFINGVLVYKASDYVPLRRGLISHFPALNHYYGFYTLLLQLADFKTGKLHITRRILETLTGHSRCWILRALQKLEKLNYISYCRPENQFRILEIIIHKFKEELSRRLTGEQAKPVIHKCRRIAESSKKVAVANASQASSSRRSSDNVSEAPKKSIDYKKLKDYKKSIANHSGSLEVCACNLHQLLAQILKDLKVDISNRSLKAITNNYCKLKKSRGWCKNLSYCQQEIAEALSKAPKYKIKHPPAYIKQTLTNYLNEKADEINKKAKREEK